MRDADDAAGIVDAIIPGLQAARRDDERAGEERRPEERAACDVGGERLSEGGEYARHHNRRGPPAREPPRDVKSTRG